MKEGFTRENRMDGKGRRTWLDAASCKKWEGGAVSQGMWVASRHRKGHGMGPL